MLYITTGHHASKYKPTAPNYLYSYRFPVMPRATATTFSVSLKTT